jgi:hypothetical protein
MKDTDRYRYAELESHKLPAYSRPVASDNTQLKERGPIGNWKERYAEHVELGILPTAYSCWKDGYAFWEVRTGTGTLGYLREPYVALSEKNDLRVLYRHVSQFRRTQKQQR